MLRGEKKKSQEAKEAKEAGADNSGGLESRPAGSENTAKHCQPTEPL